MKELKNFVLPKLSRYLLTSLCFNSAPSSGVCHNHTTDRPHVLPQAGTLTPPPQFR
jgi:hypothetical protein